MRERHLPIPPRQLLAWVSLHVDSGRHLDVAERPDRQQIHAEHYDAVAIRGVVSAETIETALPRQEAPPEKLAGGRFLERISLVDGSRKWIATAVLLRVEAQVHYCI
jgi:hypothetical protein